MTDDNADLAEVIRRERMLLEPSLRADPGSVEELLHPDFVEHGASGRMWDRAAIVAAMTADPAVSGPSTDFVAVRLAEQVVLLTYRIEGGNGSRRSSVWVRDPDLGWRVRFHQGTRSPSPESCD